MKGKIFAAMKRMAEEGTNAAPIATRATADPPAATESAPVPATDAKKREEEAGNPTPHQTLDHFTRAIGDLPRASEKATRGNHMTPPYSAGLRVVTPSLNVVEEAQIAAVHRPTGMAALDYKMGSIGAVHIANYPAPQISIGCGLFIGVNDATSSLVWRETSEIENPRLIPTLANHEDEERSTKEALEYARSYTERPGYCGIDTLIGSLAGMGIVPICSVRPEYLDIVSGMFVAQNWEGVVLYRHVNDDELPTVKYGNHKINISKMKKR